MPDFLRGRNDKFSTKHNHSSIINMPLAYAYGVIISYGLHNLQGLLPAFIASSLLL